jgi:hypothetical protein
MERYWHVGAHVVVDDVERLPDLAMGLREALVRPTHFVRCRRLTTINNPVIRPPYHDQTLELRGMERARQEINMIKAARLGAHLALGVVLGVAANGYAATAQTFGSGSAVTTIDRAATFDPMTASNAVNLDTYGEGKLGITTASTSWGEDPSLPQQD